MLRGTLDLVGGSNRDLEKIIFWRASRFDLPIRLPTRCD